MKKLLAALLCMVMALGVAGCESPSESDVTEKTYTIAAVDGAPALAIADLYDGYVFDNGGEKVKIETKIIPSAQTLQASMINGEYDMAVMPLNMASILYNKGAKVKLASVNIFGVLYLVGTGEASSLSDLKGKVVYNLGQGGTPDYTFRYILDRNNIKYEVGDEVKNGDTVYLQYVTAGSELIPLLKAGTAKYGILGEPAVTMANQKTGSKILFDLQAEWKKINSNLNYVQAGIIVSDKIYSDDALLNGILSKLGGNNTFLTENVGNLKTLLTGNGSSLTVDFTTDILKRCNLDCKKAADVKADVNNYLSVLYGYNKASVGGKLVDDGFYC